MSLALSNHKNLRSCFTKKMDKWKEKTTYVCPTEKVCFIWTSFHCSGSLRSDYCLWGSQHAEQDRSSLRVWRAGRGMLINWMLEFIQLLCPTTLTFSNVDCIILNYLSFCTKNVINHVKQIATNRLNASSFTVKVYFYLSLKVFSWVIGKI